MVATPPFQEWNEELETAVAKLHEARRIEDKARTQLAEARTRYERNRSMLERSKKRHTDAVDGAEGARRGQAEALRRGDEAHRRGQARHRWDQQARQGASDDLRLQGQAHYWENDIRRRERDLRTAKEDTKNGTEETTELSKTTYVWQQRLKYLSTGRGSRKCSSQLPSPGLATEKGSRSPGGTPNLPSPGVSRSLAVTERATAALSELLNGMPHESAQSLRLRADSSGNITLTPDTARASDVVVTLNGEAVLLIESPLPDGLEGATLDVGDFAGGSEITLSR